MNWLPKRDSKADVSSVSPSSELVLLQGQICCTSVFQEQAPSCVLKFACSDMTCLQLANQIGLFFIYPAPVGLFHHSAPLSCPSCVLVGVLTRERVSGACFKSKLPRVYRRLCFSGAIERTHRKQGMHSFFQI